MSSHREIYARRFADSQAYRGDVWRVLAARVFQPYVEADATVLDLGCGYGELINNLHAGARYAIDANPDAQDKLETGVKFFQQDAAQPWPVREGSLDVVVTSNFFEHLPSKSALHATIGNAARALRPKGAIVAMGPNIRTLPGSYWDFIDHHVPLSDRSLVEALELAGFSRERVVERFVPYTASDPFGRPLRIHPLLVELYLRMPMAWRLLGRQFLVVARKRAEV